MNLNTLGFEIEHIHKTNLQNKKISPCGWQVWFSYLPGPGVINAANCGRRPSCVYSGVPSFPNRVISSFTKYMGPGLST